MHRRWQVVSAGFRGCGIIPDLHLVTGSDFKCVLSVSPNFYRNYLYSSSLFLCVFTLSHMGTCIPTIFSLLLYRFSFQPLHSGLHWHFHWLYPPPWWEVGTVYISTVHHLAGGANKCYSERLVRKRAWCHLMPRCVWV